MKLIIITALLMSSFSISAQTKTTFKLRNNAIKVKYIEPSKLTASSVAVIVNEVPLVHTKQFFPLNKEGEIVGKNDLNSQVNQIFKNITSAIKKAGAKIEDVVKMNICIANPEIMPKVVEQLNRKFSAEKKPAISFVSGSIAYTDALLAIDAVATSSLSVEKVEYLKSENSLTADASILPSGGVVYISGQADKGKLADATVGTLKQLEATLTYLGLKKEDVVQIKSFVCPATDFKIVEKEITAFFAGTTTPPIIYVDWVSKEPVIEIELIVASTKVAQPKTEQLEFITPTGMTASPVYSKVTRINYGEKVYISSLYGNNTDGATTEVTDIFTSLTRILSKSGSDLNHLAKATYYVSDVKASAKLNELRPKYYDPKRPPAASKATVKGVGLLGKGISVDMIGVVIKNKY